MAIDRRGFIQFLVGGAAGTVFTPIAFKMTDDLSIWSQNWPWIPKNPQGATTYVNTVSKLCPTGSGLSVRLVGGLPVRVKGNPDHPLSNGKVSALAAAEAQLLYSPARLKRPLVKTSDGAHVAVSWDEALAVLRDRLEEIKGERNKVAMVSGDETGTINEVLSALTKKLGSDKYFIMPGEIQAASQALAAMGGSGQIGYDVAGSDCVLALGADILESWGPAIANRAAFAASKEHGEEAEATFMYAGAVQTNTAVACGRENWVAVKPGTEAIFALGVANELMENSAASDLQPLKSLAAKFKADKVAAETGCSPADIKKVAKALADARKPLVIAGSAFAQGAGPATVMMGMALNMLLDNVNKPGGMTIIPEAEKALADAMDREDILANDLLAYLDKVQAGKESPEALVVYEANPFYALPKAAALKEAFDKIPFKVAFTCFFDETAAECDVVLPTAMGLERYDDVLTPYGYAEQVYSWAVPVAAPLFGAREPGDVAIELADSLGIDLGVGSFMEALEAKAEALGADTGDLEEGVPFVDSTTAEVELSLDTYKLGKALAAEAPAGSLSLAPYAKLNMGSRYVPTPPFNLKTIRDTELLGGDLFVQVNAKTAQGLGVAEGDLVEVKSAAGSCQARIHIHCGVMDNVVAAPLGFGHTHTDDYTQGKGGNVADLMVTALEDGTRSTVWNRTMVEIAKK